jgi:hypothetical protein
MKQKWAYVVHKGKQMLLGFKQGITLVKMKKPRKKKSLASSWEGPFFFVKYLNGNGFMDQDEGGIICVIKGEKNNYGINLEETCKHCTPHLMTEDSRTQSKLYGNYYICDEDLWDEILMIVRPCR